MRQWILDANIATEDTLQNIEKDAQKQVREAKTAAWKAFLAPQKQEHNTLMALLKPLTKVSETSVFITPLISKLEHEKEPLRRDMLATARNVLRKIRHEKHPEKQALQQWVSQYTTTIQPKYSSHLYSESNTNATNISAVAPIYKSDETVDGRIIVRDNFEALFKKYPQALIFGEDSGKIGDVNQGLEGLQDKFGENRVADAGIREATILGQGIGMAMRGLRPIAEIQYLDYILYALQIMSDDLVTVRYRSLGKQKAPLIVRTRGHRLEGIWHSGSQMGGLIHLLRGMYILVPRDMTQAAGFYNTLMEADEPALVVECLNGYRLKEKRPSNLGAFKTPIGVVDVLREGKDITVVSYGSTLRLVMEAAKQLQELNIDIEVIDAQSLIPFDNNQTTVESVKKTNRLLVVDEDVPGGASAYLLQQIIETQNAYQYLDSAPQTLTAKAHRPAYGTDGDYFSKPSLDDIVEKVYAILHESNPKKYPSLF